MEDLYVEFVCKCIYVYFTYILDGAGMAAVSAWRLLRVPGHNIWLREAPGRLWLHTQPASQLDGREAPLPMCATKMHTSQLEPVTHQGAAYNLYVESSTPPREV